MALFNILHTSIQFVEMCLIMIILSDFFLYVQNVDRPTQGHIFLSREYVKPQWVYDCVNARIILPTEDYMVGR
jgi:hypothetical protein